MSGIKNALKKAVHGGYRHFPGTGPPGEFCRTCDHIMTQNLSSKCSLTMEHFKNSKIRGVDPYAAACKYHKRKRNNPPRL